MQLFEAVMKVLLDRKQYKEMT